MSNISLGNGQKNDKSFSPVQSSALEAASGNGHMDVVQFLVESGAEVENVRFLHVAHPLAICSRTTRFKKARQAGTIFDIQHSLKQIFEFLHC